MSSTSAWFLAFSIPFNGLLFLFRIRAVFHDSKKVVFLFCVLWVVELGCSLVLPFGSNVIYAKELNSCLDTFIAEFVSLGPMVSWIYDTLVFVAISARLVSYVWVPGVLSWKARFRAFFLGSRKGLVSQALLQTGQVYYL